MLKNVNIRAKIMGVVISILILMVTTSLISTYYISKVKNELENIAEFLVPITQQLTEAEVHILEQEIKFEKILEAFETSKVDSQIIDKNIEGYEGLGRKVSEEIESGKNLAEDALKISTTYEMVSGFSKLLQSFDMIKEGHVLFQKHGAEIIQFLKRRNYDYAHLLENWMEEEEDKLNGLLEKTLVDVENLTEFAAKEAEHHQKMLQILTWLITGSAVVVGVLFSAVVSARMVKPLKGLLHASQKLGDGDLDTMAPVTSRDEIGRLSADFNNMVAGIRQKERIRSTFGQYLDPRIVNSLMNSYDFEEVKSVEATIFFSDIAGFSRISEQFTADAMVKLVNEYLSEVSEPITLRQGVIDKIIGDAVVAFWSPPFTNLREGAINSCISALDQQNKIEIFKNKISDITGLKKFVPNINVRMGIATGPCLLGNIGSARSKSFTTIGPAMDWAEQLEVLNKEYNTKILVSENTFDHAKEKMEFRKIENRNFTGLGEKAVFELLGPVDGVPKEVLAYRDLYEKSLSYFQAGDTAQALGHFKKCADLMPDDGAVAKHLKLIEAAALV